MVKIAGAEVPAEFAESLDKVNGIRLDRWCQMGKAGDDWPRKMQEMIHFLDVCTYPSRRLPLEELRRNTTASACHSVCGPEHHLGHFYDAEREFLMGKRCYAHLIYLFSHHVPSFPEPPVVAPQ